MVEIWMLYIVMQDPKAKDELMTIHATSTECVEAGKFWVKKWSDGLMFRCEGLVDLAAYDKLREAERLRAPGQ